jgi:hypothetical protein
VSSTQPESVSVPDGHAVTIYAVRSTPCIEASAMGLLLAHLGFGGDDPAEVLELVGRAVAELEKKRSDPPTMLFVDETSQVSDLFEPATPKSRELGIGIVWTVCQDGLLPVLENATQKERLLEHFRAASFAQQWLIVDDQWRTDEAFESELRSLNISLLQWDPSGPFLAEVRRPDGRCLCGFVTRKLVAAAEGKARPLHRAPLLRSRLLDAVAHGASPSFYEELLARHSPLLFFADANRAPRMMTWPDVDTPFLPVFADLPSANRAASELGMEPGTVGIGALPARKMIAWASNAKFGIALGVYPDEGKVLYLVLDVPTIAKLAAQ